MQVKLSERARGGILDCCRLHDIKPTHLLEAIGEMLADGVEVIDDSAVERAVAIRRERDYRYED